MWQKHNGSGPSSGRFRRVHELAVHFTRSGLPWGDVYRKVQHTMDARRKTVRRKARPIHWGDIGAASYRSEEGGPRQMTSVVFAKSCHGRAIAPTQKPDGILRPLISYSCPPGGRLLEPFAGSGSALHVARSLGLRAVGVEADPVQAEKAAEWLSQPWQPDFL